MNVRSVTYHHRSFRTAFFVLSVTLLVTASSSPTVNMLGLTHSLSDSVSTDDGLAVADTGSEDKTGHYEVEIANDKDDDQWTWNETLGNWQSHVTASWYISLTNQRIIKYVGQFRFRIDVSQGTNIISATLSAWESTDQQSGFTSTIKRIDETNVGPLEDDTVKPVPSDDVIAHYSGWDTVDEEWTDPIDVKDLVQDQVDLPDWQSGFYMAFEWTWTAQHNYIYLLEDYQHPQRANHAYLSITYGQEPPAKWYGDYVYRNAHVIRQTAGAGTDHTVSFNVYSGSGNSYGNTAYLDWKAMAGFTDVRFTDENHTPLDYWLEGYYYSEPSTDYYTDTVSYFGMHERIYPSAVYYNNRTYITYQGEGKNPMVTYYDHMSRTWAPEIEIAQSPLVDDDHGPPAMWIDNGGYIHVFFGAHNDPVPHVKSTYPERIDAWTDMGTIGTAYDGDAYSYPVVAYDALNDVVHFWARGFEGGYSTLAYRNSTDNGVSWSKEQSIVRMDSALAWPYKGAGGLDNVNPEIVHMCWATYNSSDTTRNYQDIRYVYLNATTGVVYNVTGHSQGYEVTSQEYDNTLAWDSRGSHVYGPAMKVPSTSSEPYFVFQVSEEGGRYSTMVFWNSTSSSWDGEHNITKTTTNWGGGADLIIYARDNVSAFVTTGTGDVGHWRWNGRGWSFVEWCYNAAMGRSLYLIGARAPVSQDTWNYGHDESLQLIMTEYSSSAGDHIKMYAWGSEGIVRHSTVVGAKLWVKIPANLSETDITMYIYYGNPSAWSVGDLLATSSAPVVEHGAWSPTERRTIIDTTSGYDVTRFYETLHDDYMLFPDDESQGYYFVEDGVDLSDWTYTDSAPQTDGDVVSLSVLGDSKFDYFICNDASMPAGYYYLEYYHRASVAATSYYRIDVFEEDGGQGRSTFIDEIYCTTSWSHHKMGIRIDHPVESIRIGAKATVVDTEFQIDWIRFTNETGWQHDCSSTYGVTTSGSGASMRSDGDYLILSNTGGSFAYFDFTIDPTATQTMLDDTLYPFLHIDFHPDDSDDWYYLLIYDSDSYDAGIQSATNWAVDTWWNIGEANTNAVKTLRFSFSGSRTIRIDTMKLYFIANFTLFKNSQGIRGSLHVENGSLVCGESLNNWMILEYDINPAMNLDYNRYNSIEVSRSSANHSLSFAYYTDTWSGYDRAQIIEGPSTKCITRFRLKVSNAGTVYSVRFGNAPRGLGSAPVNVQPPGCLNLDDSNRMYARQGDYQISMYVSDPDGYADVRYMDLTLVSGDKVTRFWTIRYDGYNGIFSEGADPFDYISLNTISSTQSSAGNDTTVTFDVSINWKHPDLTDAGILCYVTDLELYSHSDYYMVNWDVETRLELPGGPIIGDDYGTPDRGDINGDMMASGSVVYYGSRLHPPASEIDMYVISPDVPDSPWRAGNYGESSGTFSVVVSADDEVGQDVYRFKVVSKDEGAAGIDLLDHVYACSYIADCIVGVISEDESSSTNTTVSFALSLTYAYDGTQVSDFTATIGKNGLEWLVVSSTSFVDESDAENENAYTIMSVTETLHGLTALRQPQSPFVPSGDIHGSDSASRTSPEVVVDLLHKIQSRLSTVISFLTSFVFRIDNAVVNVLETSLLFLTQWNTQTTLIPLVLFLVSILIIPRSRRYTRTRATRRREILLKSGGGLQVYTLLPMNGQQADLRIVLGESEMSCLILENDHDKLPERLGIMPAAGEGSGRLLKLLSEPMENGQGVLCILGLVWESS